jgi:hypothetical protein
MLSAVLHDLLGPRRHSEAGQPVLVATTSKEFTRKVPLIASAHFAPDSYGLRFETIDL